MNLFCFGMGYSATFFAKELLSEGWKVSGTCRSLEKVQHLKNQGISAYVLNQDYSLEEPQKVFDKVTHVLVSIPPDSAGDWVFEKYSDFLLQIKNSLVWLGYLSTTGVYGDRQGAWVSEDDEVKPQAERAQQRVIAEEKWLSLFKIHKLSIHVFRLSGIYGPSRSVLDRIKAGLGHCIVKENHLFSRIHVADIVTVLRASMVHPEPGAIYNVCDDFPQTSHKVIMYGCDLLGVPYPLMMPFEEAQITGFRRHFYLESRKVSNQKIKQNLGVQLRFPSYKEGLKELLKGL